MTNRWPPKEEQNENGKETTWPETGNWGRKKEGAALSEQVGGMDSADVSFAYAYSRSWRTHRSFLTGPEEVDWTHATNIPSHSVTHLGSLGSQFKRRGFIFIFVENGRCASAYAVRAAIGTCSGIKNCTATRRKTCAGSYSCSSFVLGCLRSLKRSSGRHPHATNSRLAAQGWSATRQYGQGW